MTEDTRYDVLIRRIKDQKWFSLILVFGVAFLALVSLAKGLQEAGSILGKAFSHSTIVPQYDASTKEALIAVAREVDLFFWRRSSFRPKPHDRAGLRAG